MFGDPNEPTGAVDRPVDPMQPMSALPDDRALEVIKQHILSRKGMSGERLAKWADEIGRAAWFMSRGSV